MNTVCILWNVIHISWPPVNYFVETSEKVWANSVYGRKPVTPVQYVIMSHPIAEVLSVIPMLTVYSVATIDYFSYFFCI